MTSASRTPNALFDHLVSAVTDYAIFAMDLEGTIASWNIGAERMKLWKADEIIGQNLSLLYTPDDQAAGLPAANLREALATGGYRHETRRVKKGGATFPAFISITPIFDEEGHHIGYSKVTQDLTRQKRAEALQKQVARQERSRLNLKRKVAENKCVALLAANTYKDDFLAIVSHELRTPINAIMGFASILDDKVAGPLSDVQQQFARRILSSAEVLLSLIDDLLDMSRIQAGKFSVTPARMDFEAVLTHVLERLRPLLDARPCSCKVVIPPDLPCIMGDEGRVAQVLSNLLTNAIKYTSPDCRIEVHAVVTGDAMRCEVRDNGQGIASEACAKLFRPFEQVDTSSTRKVGGVGLGLSIVKALVEAQGGRVGVESVVGRGSTFWFTLPLAP